MSFSPASPGEPISRSLTLVPKSLPSATIGRGAGGGGLAEAGGLRLTRSAERPSTPTARSQLGAAEAPQAAEHASRRTQVDEAVHGAEPGQRDQDRALRQHHPAEIRAEQGLDRPDLRDRPDDTRQRDRDEADPGPGREPARRGQALPGRRRPKEDQQAGEAADPGRRREPVNRLDGDLAEPAAACRGMARADVDHEGERRREEDEDPPSTRRPARERQRHERPADEHDPGRAREGRDADRRRWELFERRAHLDPLDGDHAHRSSGGEQPADGGHRQQVRCGPSSDDHRGERRPDEDDEPEVQDPAGADGRRRSRLADAARIAAGRSGRRCDADAEGE